MSALGLVSLFAAIAVSALVQIFTDPRISHAFIARSFIALAVYAVHITVAFLVIVYLLPHGPDTAAPATAAFVGWIGLGALGLLRFAPRLREPPRWLMRFGIADLVCLALIAGGLTWATGIFR